MGFRLFRIGNKSVGEVKTLSFRRSLRNSMAVVYIVALVTILFLAKSLGYEHFDWLARVGSIMVAITILAIDKQLPSRRWKNLSLTLLLMGVAFVAFGVWRFAVDGQPLDSKVWILVAMVLLSLGYGFYSLWRWMRNISWYKELSLQRELRARRRRKMV